MEVQHGSKTVGDLRTQPETTEEMDDFSSPSKNFSFVSSPSSDSDSSTVEFEPDANQTSTTDTLNLRQEQSMSGSASPPLVSGNGHDMSSANGSTTQSTSGQTMEQIDPYRIPSSAFVTNKSKMEWSVASNESLFSIHGNMSFNRDQSFTLSKSGELGTPEDSSSRGVSLRYPEDETPAVDEKSAKLEEAADGTKKEVLKENAEDNIKEKLASPSGPRNSSRRSQHSDGSRSSVQSFAFPM